MGSAHWSLLNTITKLKTWGLNWWSMSYFLPPRREVRLFGLFNISVSALRLFPDATNWELPLHLGICSIYTFPYVKSVLWRTFNIVWTRTWGPGLVVHPITEKRPEVSLSLSLAKEIADHDLNRTHTRALNCHLETTANNIFGLEAALTTSKHWGTPSNKWGDPACFVKETGVLHTI